MYLRTTLHCRELSIFQILQNPKGIKAGEVLLASFGALLLSRVIPPDGTSFNERYYGIFECFNFPYPACLRNLNL